MNIPSRTGMLVVSASVAVAAVAAGCGGSTVEGSGVTTTSSAAASGATSIPANTFGEERPAPVSSEITPPSESPPSPEPEPGGGVVPPEPAPQPAPAQPAPAPGTGDFQALLASRDVVLPAGKDPVALAGETCARFDEGQTTEVISGWLGGETGFDPDKIGFFLGTAVATYCPQNFPKLG